MLVILVVAVVSVPAVVDGTAYLAGAGRTVTFDPVSYQATCDRYSCLAVTDGILGTGGAGISASWQNVVPLGQPRVVTGPQTRPVPPGGTISLYARAGGRSRPDRGAGAPNRKFISV